MPRFRLIIAACLATFAVGAVASATAMAGEWDVNGKPLVGSAALANTALVLKEGQLSITAGETLTIKCKAHEISINEGKLVAPDSITAKDLTFHECAAAPTTCKLTSPLILTLPVHGLASLEGPLNTLIVVLPQTKTLFTNIGFEGANCALSGTQPVTGKAHLLIHEGIHSAVTHLILAFSLPGQLKVGLNEATLEGVDADLKLANGATWNFL